MGRLEEMVVQLAGIYGTAQLGEVADLKPVVVIMGADNGVVAEGVSQTGSEVTAQVLEIWAIANPPSVSCPGRWASRLFR